MTRKILIFLLIVMQIHCKNESNLLDKEWILIYKENIETGEYIPSYRNKRFQFKENKIKETFLIIKAESVRDYKLENNEIKFDTSTGKKYHYLRDSLILEEKNKVLSLGEIIHLSRDSLVIREDKFISTYKPLKQTKFSSNDAEELYSEFTQNVWQLKIKDDFIKFYCDTTKWRGRFEDMDWVKYISYQDTHTINDFDDIYSGEYWTIEYFDGKILFIYSYGESENQFIQITNIEEERITGELLHYYSLYGWDYVELKKVHPAKDLEKITKNKLVGNWSSNILYNYTGDNKSMFISTDKTDTINIDLPIDSTDFISEEPLKFWIDEKRITIDDLKSENLTFNFQQNGKYEIKAGERIIRKGNNWNFTKDNNYIYLDSPVHSDNFIKIISFEDNIFEIQKTERINIKTENPDYCLYKKLRLKLIKDKK